MPPTYTALSIVRMLQAPPALVAYWRRTVAAVSAEQLETVRTEIELARALVSGSSALRLFGYQRVERRWPPCWRRFSPIACSMAGLTLVGSHAYGSLVNELGVAAPSYTTQDIDVARGQPLELRLPAVAAFETILSDSGLQFVPVPGMPSRRPSGSFKIPGADALSVDILAPGKTLGNIVPLPELGTHAREVPLLYFLVEEPIEAIALGPNHVVPVRVPAPERFVLHKLVSSQERSTDRAKARKTSSRRRRSPRRWQKTARMRLRPRSATCRPRRARRPGAVPKPEPGYSKVLTLPGAKVSNR